MLGWLAKLQSTTHPFTAVVDVVFEAGNTQTDTDTQRWGPAMPPINIDAPLLMSKRTQQDSNQIFIGTVGRADRGGRKEVDGQKWTERGGGRTGVAGSRDAERAGRRTEIISKPRALIATCFHDYHYYSIVVRFGRYGTAMRFIKIDIYSALSLR